MMQRHALALAGALLFLFAALSSPDLLGAQEVGVLTGRVMDARTGEPWSGIEVRVEGARALALTGDDGRFVLSGLAAGSYRLSFTGLGYRTRQVEAEVTGGGTTVLDVELDPEPIALGEIVVTTASRQPERVLESPASVVSVPPARVRALSTTGQTPLLVAELPGVYLMQSGVNSFNVNVRGFNGLLTRRLLVLKDGRDLSVPLVGTQEWPGISVSGDASRVELVKGPASALYGANAFSGVLNILTPTARQIAGTRLSVTGGDPTALAVDGRWARVSQDLRWGVAVRGGYSRSDTWDRSRTELGTLTEEYADAAPSEGVGSVPPPGFELLPLAGQSRAGPFGAPAPVTGTPDPLITGDLSARLDHYLEGGGVLTAEGGYTVMENQVSPSGASRAQVVESRAPWARLDWSQDDVSLMAHYTARSGEQNDLATGRLFEDESSRIHLEGQLRRTLLADRARFVVGASVRSEHADSRGTVLAPARDDRTDRYWAAFTQGQLELVRDRLRLILSVRVDDASLFDPEVAPKAGVVWTPNGSHALRLTWGRAYLMPSVAQRFVSFALGPPTDLSALEAGLRGSPLGQALEGVPEGALLGISAAVPIRAEGNRSLGPEEVMAWEAGYKGQFDRLFLTVDLHQSRYDDFWTDLLPGVHPEFDPWVAPSTIPAAARPAVEEAVRSAVPGLTNLAGGDAGIVFASTRAGRATQSGLDLTAGFQASDRLRLDGGWSFLQTSFEDGTFLGADSVPTNTPTHTATAAVSYTEPQGRDLRLGLRVAGAYDFRSGVWQGRVPGRQTLNLSAGSPLHDAVNLRLVVTNLLDQRRYHHFGGSVIGRRITATLTWEP